MNKFYLVFLTIWITDAIGQVEYQVSDPVDSKVLVNTSSLVQMNDQSILSLISTENYLGKETQRTVFYDKSLKIQNTKELNRKKKILQFVNLKKNTFSIEAFSKDGAIRVQKIDSELNPLGNSVEVLTMHKDPQVMTLRKTLDKYKLPQISISPDESKIAFIQEHRVAGYKIQTYTAKIYDENMNLLWNKEFDFGKKWKEFGAFYTSVDNDGNLYYYTNLRTHNGIIQQYYDELLLLKINKDSVQKYTKDFDNEKEFIRDIFLDVQEEYINLYAVNGNNKKSLKKSLVSKLTITRLGKDLQRKQELNLDLNREDKKEDKNFEVIHIEQLKNGNKIILLEDYEWFSSSNPYSSTSSYLYGNTLAIALDSNDKEIWRAEAEKKQGCGLDQAICGTAYLFSENELYLFYNTKNHLVSAVIDYENGNLRNDVVYENNQAGVQSYPRDFIPLNDSQIAFQGKSKKGISQVVLTVN